MIGKALKKSAILAALCVAVALAAGALGCGGDESKARESLEAGHEEGLEVSKNLEKLGKKEKELDQLYQKTGQVTPENLETIRKPYLELVELVGAVKASAEKTKSQYDKVMKLKDVKDYKDYANLKTKALDLLIKEVGLAGDLYAVFNRVAEEQAAGRPVDEAAVNNSIDAIIAEVAKVEKEIAKAKNDAADIGDELKLEWEKVKK